MKLNEFEPFYSYRDAPPVRSFTARLEMATESLYNGLRKINPLELRISDYNQSYLQSKLNNLESALAVYADILGSVLCQSGKSLDNFVFVDYGGGTGFLSMLAKKVGVGTVVYNDIYDVSCKDARQIANILECPADHYVTGDIDSLVEFFRRHVLKADGIASYDVIEHIYDIDDFFRKLHLIAKEGATMMHASGGSIFFYPAVKQARKKQAEFESEDREEQWGHKKSDSLLSYSKGRENIIREYCPRLDASEIRQMVERTRGLRRDDILKCIDRYLKDRAFPQPIEDPTNTCDPFTGNWEEHLMNPYYLQETLYFNGFDTRVLPRYWGGRHGFLQNTVASIVNRIIRVSGTYTGLHICPYIALYSRYTGVFLKEAHAHHLYRRRRTPIWYLVMLTWEILSRLRYRPKLSDLPAIHGAIYR